VLTRFVRSCLQRQTLRLASCASFPDEHEGRPESGMRLVVLSGIDYGQHRASQRFCAADFWIGLQLRDGFRNELNGGVRRYLAMSGRPRRKMRAQDPKALRLPANHQRPCYMLKG
jgi:hypothetical protein